LRFLVLSHKKFRGLVFTCEDSEKLPNGSCQIPDGETQIRALGFENTNIGINFIILGGMFIFFQLLAYGSLQFMFRRSKSNT